MVLSQIQKLYESIGVFNPSQVRNPQKIGNSRLRNIEMFTVFSFKKFCDTILLEVFRFKISNKFGTPDGENSGLGLTVTSTWERVRPLPHSLLVIVPNTPDRSEDWPPTHSSLP